ncbi:MAG TPA: c-type cytochrome [Gemmatimonadaceae bacterium]|nr:c-type cytochrome [Gemmatimonadaceae bacterium]
MCALRPLTAGLLFAYTLLGCAVERRPTAPASVAAALLSGTPMNPGTLADGKQIFRFDTYGDESYWTDTLRMHEVIASSVSPATALAVGLKVDMDALPRAVVQAIQQGKVDLNSPATTVTLLKLGAVVGLEGSVDANNTLTSVGITCALCHSTVDDAFARGIGHRLDGWPNRDLNVGAIVALSPNVPPSLKAILNTWGPGKYDPRINIDGKNTPLVIPPAFGMRHVARETYTADGVVSYWNDYVAVTQMHGHGNFSDTRVGVSITNPPELVSPKLEALRAYQFSLETPAPPGRQVDGGAAKRGKQVFMGAAGCASCHYGVGLSDINAGVLHSPAEVGQDPAYALRTATKLYRTTPLRGLWHPPQLRGPYFHDGSAATLEQVVDHYVVVFHLALSAQQKSDLVAYLKTL